MCIEVNKIYTLEKLIVDITLEKSKTISFLCVHYYQYAGCAPEYTVLVVEIRVSCKNIVRQNGFE